MISRTKHNVVDKVLPRIIGEHWRRIGFAQRPDIASIRQLCREVNLLHPQVDDNGRRPDNVEYPWTGASGDAEVPARWEFLLVRRLYSKFREIAPQGGGQSHSQSGGVHPVGAAQQGLAADGWVRCAHPPAAEPTALGGRGMGMTRERALELLRAGGAGVARWNRWRARHPQAAERPDLSHADLSGANLSGANLSDLPLLRSNLARARLFGAVLDRCNLSESRLEAADINAASLRQANLRGANLRRAILFGADLRGAELTNTSFQGAECDETTQWSASVNLRVLGVTSWPSG